MQPLHKIYGLITYLIYTIYFYNNLFFEFWILYLYLFKSYLKKLQFLQFILMSISKMIQNHVNFNNYSMYMNMRIFF
jgi:hypothetical protein